jgi:hypothetical protein
MRARMLLEQGGLCDICRKREPDRLDHDHVRGNARGLLCNICNLLLGLYEIEERWIDKAEAYVSKHRTLKIRG